MIGRKHTTHFVGSLLAMTALTGAVQVVEAAAGILGQGMKTFTNSRSNLNGNLASRYEDFSFSYPANWERDPKAGVPGAINFVKVSRNLPGNFTQENFAVGSYSGHFGTNVSAATRRAVIYDLLNQLAKQFAAGFPNFKKLSQNDVKIGAYSGHELRFTAYVPKTPKGPITLWGRTTVIPEAKNPNKGVMLIMLATNLAPGVHGAEDVGVKGQMPAILSSFRLGKGH